MSLAFLFKKTWHPSTLQNSERVWVAEQKDAAEKRRIEELTKRVREEQQVRELEEMQAAGGNGPERKERIDWMYEGPMQSTQDQQAEANEYLLGKEFKMKDKGTSELKKLEETKAPGTMFIAPAATTANEAFRRVQEDPLLKMRKARMEAEQSVVNNPVKMSRIRQQLEEELTAKAEKKKAKKAKKDAKKEKKKERKKEKAAIVSRKQGHDSSSSISSDEGHRPERSNDMRREPLNGGFNARGTGRDCNGRGGGRESRWGSNSDQAAAGGGDRRGGDRRHGDSGRDSRERDGTRHNSWYGKDGRGSAREDGASSSRGGRRKEEGDEAEGRRSDLRRYEGGNGGGDGQGETERKRDRDGDYRDRDRSRGFSHGGHQGRESAAGNDRRRRGETQEERGGGRAGRGWRDGRDNDDAAESNSRGHHPRVDRRRRKPSFDTENRGESPSPSRSPPTSRRSRASLPVGGWGRDNNNASQQRSSRWGDSKRSRSRSNSPVSAPEPAPAAQAAAGAPSVEKRYGLLGASKQTGAARGEGGGLGPSASLLESKERERSNRERERNEARRRRAMTPEEKMRRLKEMEDDGTRNQELKKQRVEHGKRADSQSVGAAPEGGKGGKEASSASFLDKLRGDQVDSMGLEERMQRNRHYQQRGADVHNFMKRG